MAAHIILVLSILTFASGISADKIPQHNQPCTNSTVLLGTCQSKCQYGNRFEEGCPICACAPNPCDKTECPKPQVCKAVDVHDLPFEKRAKCVDITVPDRCQAPMLHGPCLKEFPNWYYDTKEHMCKEFTFGGCNGNSNRFLTAMDCRRICIVEPEHQAKYPNCPLITSKECLNYCKYGHALVNGCPSCSCRTDPCQKFTCKDDEVCRLKGCFGRHNCQEGKAVCLPRCQVQPKPCPPCRYGYDADKEGCPTCTCLPDPCQTHTCPELQTCSAVVDKECLFSPCPRIPTCTALRHVFQIDVQMMMMHDGSLSLPDAHGLKQELRTYFSKLLDVREDSILNLQLDIKDKESFIVKITVRTYGAVDLTQKYYDMKSNLSGSNVHSSLPYKGKSVTLAPNTLHATVSKGDPHTETHKMYRMAAVAAGIVCGVIAMVILLAIVIIAIKRRRHATYRNSSNMSYKGVSIRRSGKEDEMAIM